MGIKDIKNRMHNRCDSKWGHPELVEENMYTAAGDFFLVEKHTAEEYKEYRENFRAPMMDAYNASMTPEMAARGSWTDILCEQGCAEEPDAPVRISYWMPNDVRPDEKLPAVFYIVGGGLVSGGTTELAKFGMAHNFSLFYIRAVYVTFEYRTAGEGKYTAAINDGHAAYEWMLKNADMLHLDTDRIVIWGSSSGAHLAISLAFRLKRYDWCKGPMPRGIISQEPPMNDIGQDDSDFVSFRNENSMDMFDSEATRNTFRQWLGDSYGDPALSPEAVPCRATEKDICGYPPVWFPCEPEFDPGRDGVYRFAAMLHRAGIFCDLHVWGGGAHLMTMAVKSSIATRMNAVLYGAIRDALTYDLRRPWLIKDLAEFALAGRKTITDRALQRYDPKWAHPESYDEGWYLGPDLAPSFLGQENIPFVELGKRREAWRKPLFDVTMESTEEAQAFDWQDYYTEHGCPEEPDASVHILVGTPKDIRPGEALPAVLCFAGGGMINGGTAELNVALGSKIISHSGERVVAVYFEYRIAPMDKYPAAINDGHAAYQWMMEHSEELHIDKDKVVLWGISSGGHTALSTAFRLKRYDWCGAPMPRGIIAQLPVMDDVSEDQSIKFSYKNEKGEILCWDGELASYGFKLWLGDGFGDPSLPPEAVPNRARFEDIKGYPPVWFPSVGEFDAGRDSTYKFASLLHKAGIFCDLHEWGGTNHSFSSGENTDFAARFQLIAGGALRDAIEYDFRRPWLNEE